jgi:hypothetical protein
VRSGTDRVVLRTPWPVLGVQSLGDRLAETTATTSADRMEVTVEVDGDTGLGAVWRRAVKPDAVTSSVVNGIETITNHLAEPLAFVVLEDGAAIARDIAPGAELKRSGFETRQQWEPLMRSGMRPHEERLTRELFQQCRQTGGPCGVAIVRRPGETLGIAIATVADRVTP